MTTLWVQRTPAGDRVASLRLAGGGRDRVWTASLEPDPDAEQARASIVAAATWVRLQLDDAGLPHQIHRLILDAEGASCGWLTSPSADPRVVAAAYAQSRTAAEDAAPSDLGESSVQALTPAPHRASLTLLPAWMRRTGETEPAEPVSRLAIVALSDVVARVLIDELDARGVEVAAAVSVWHAIARAWDPSASSPGTEDERVVAASAVVTASVFIDPIGRLCWSWSRAGELLAGGSIRLRPGHAQEWTPRLLPHQVSRLSADWLAWSVQLGHAPARIVWVGPRLEPGGDWLGPAELGRSLGTLWPGASVDMLVDDDPIGATLRRLEDSHVRITPDPRARLEDLSRRPGRVHRRLYVWSSLAILAASGAVLVPGIKSRAAALDARHRAAELRSKEIDAVRAGFPAAATSPYYSLELQNEISRLSSARKPAEGIAPPPPILGELEAISTIFAEHLTDPDSQVRIKTISLLDTWVSVEAVVPNTQTGISLYQGLLSYDGSNVAWTYDFGRASATDFTLNGPWRENKP